MFNITGTRLLRGTKTLEKRKKIEGNIAEYKKSVMEGNSLDKEIRDSEVELKKGAAIEGFAKLTKSRKDDERKSRSQSFKAAEELAKHKFKVGLVEIAFESLLLDRDFKDANKPQIVKTINQFINECFRQGVVTVARASASECIPLRRFMAFCEEEAKREVHLHTYGKPDSNLHFHLHSHEGEDEEEKTEASPEEIGGAEEPPAEELPAEEPMPEHPLEEPPKKEEKPPKKEEKPSKEEKEKKPPEKTKAEEKKAAKNEKFKKEVAEKIKDKVAGVVKKEKDQAKQRKEEEEELGESLVPSIQTGKPTLFRSILSNSVRHLMASSEKTGASGIMKFALAEAILQYTLIEMVHTLKFIAPTIRAVESLSTKYSM